MVKKAADPGTTVRVRLSSTTQVAGGPPITATATAIQNGFVLPNATLKFEVEGSARFDDTQAATTEGTTGADGRITKTFSDSVPETGYLSVTLDPGISPTFDEAAYSFTPVPTRLELISVDDANGFADGVSRISVRVVLRRADSGEEVPDETICFTLIASEAALFPQTGGPSCTARTAQNGQARADIVDTMVEIGEVVAYVESDPLTRLRFRFLSRPVPMLDFVVQPREVRADGRTAMTATVTVLAAMSRDPMADVSVCFILPDWVKPTRPGEVCAVDTGADGQAQVSFTSTRAGLGSVSVVVQANPDKYGRQAEFQFLPMPPPTQFGLEVQPGQATADGNHAIIATATVGYWETGERLEGANVIFDVPAWVTPIGPVEVATGRDGTAQLSFTSTTAGGGEAHAILEIDPDKYKAARPFQFNAP